MASNHGHDNDAPVPMDYPAHEDTYQGFIVAAKWGTIFVVTILILMAYFLL